MYANPRKNNEPNSRKWQKYSFETNFGPNSGFQNFFFKNLALPVTRYYRQLSSCKISETTNDPILRKLSDGQTDGRTEGQTDESNFIGCCPTNVKHLILKRKKEIQKIKKRLNAKMRKNIAIVPCIKTTESSTMSKSNETRHRSATTYVFTKMNANFH